MAKSDSSRTKPCRRFNRPFVRTILVFSLLTYPLDTNANQADKKGEGLADQPTTSGQPPWRKEPTTETARPLTPPATPREALSNIKDDEIESLFDQAMLAPGNRTLLKILYRLPRMGLDNIQRYAEQTPDLSSSQLLNEAIPHRLKMFRLRGRVKRVDAFKLASDDADLFEFQLFYRVTLTIGDSETPVAIFANRVPAAWPPKTAIDEPASCFGLLLNAHGTDDGPMTPTLTFASPRVAWHPDRENTEADIGPSHLLLAKLGMDLGLFDDVRQRNRKGLDSPEDAECFYQLLAAVGQADANELSRASQKKFELGPLLLEASKQHGRLLSIQGNARRITKIDIDQPYYRDRLGIDHYFEIDVFVSLGNQRVRLGKSDGDQDGPVFDNNFPVTICAVELPTGLEPAENLNEAIRIPCFYFKLWAYRSQFVRDFGRGQGQVSPMLVGLEPQRMKYDRSANPYVTALGVSIFVLALGGIWVGLWIYGRGDKKFDRETLRRQFEVPKGQSLDDLNLEAEDKPDFSGLE